MSKKRLTRSDSCLQTVKHREGIYNCPHCDHNPEDSSKGAFSDALFWWGNNAEILICAVVRGRHDSVALVTECPKCFKKSWCHFPLSGFDYYPDLPKNWASAVEEEEHSRHILAARNWSFGLCGRCEHLKSVTLNTSARRTCAIGFGGPLRVCDMFKAVDPPKEDA